MPKNIFFTGVPGSRWSSIASDLETLPGMNISSHSASRAYRHVDFSGHTGVYFGRGMEFSADLDCMTDTEAMNHIDGPWVNSGGTRIVKSHEWAYQLSSIKRRFPDSWIILVYRPDMASYTWWHQAGGFDISYPSYAAYGDSNNMLSEISKQNSLILHYGYECHAKWSYYTEEWIVETFGCRISPISIPSDILVTVIK